GIDDLRVFTARSARVIPIYGSAATLATIRQGFSYIFTDAPEPGFVPRLETLEAHDRFELFGRPVEAIPLEHGKFPCQGYRIGPLAYLTDCNGISEESRAKLHGLELLVLDGLRLKPHATHFNIAQAVAAAQQIGAKRTLLTHLSHEIDHERHNRELPPGIELAYDGQRVRLPYADQRAPT
ncbi:MAG: MBL fold metallo-hydrolase, partial [Desulfuromonas sp.]